MFFYNIASFFYSVIAKNFNKTGTFTFDNLQATNGFQPLWLAVQIVAQYIFKHIEPAAVLGYSSYFTYLIFAGLISYPLIKKADYISLTVLSTLLLLNHNFFHNVLKGLETPAVLAMLALLVNIIEAKISNLRSVMLGLSAGGLFLARTDMFCG
ncbi:MAG: hypothetical protein ACYSSI_14595, partial [Planctomycetota bacterium]